MNRNGLIFDGTDYAKALSHIGTPCDSLNSNVALLRRTIPGCDYEDIVGPWPYGSAPSISALRGVVEGLSEARFISLTMILRPDTELPEYDDGVDVVPLKEHYILDPDLPAPALRPKTRRNLSIAERHWTIEPLPSCQIGKVGAALHRLLTARRSLSDFANVSEAHFHVLAGLEGIEAMAACDEDGPGAILIAARTKQQTHLLHLLTSPRILPTCGTYLLMFTALRHWSQQGRVYLGGAPSSADGPGIAQFKARWANRTAPVFLLKSVLNPEMYRMLAGTRSQSAFFPAYRGANA